MELTLDKALQKGIEAQEADQYYTAILKATPKHPDANHNMGVPIHSVIIERGWSEIDTPEDLTNAANNF